MGRFNTDTPWRMSLSAAGVLYGLSVIAACVVSSPPDRSASSDSDPARARIESRSTLPHCGFAISLHHTDHFADYLASVDQIAAMGFDSLAVVTPAFQPHGASDSVRLETGPGRGPHREQLVRLLRHARARGLDTLLMPVVLFTAPRGNEWRGKIHPGDWDAWWASYRRVLDHFLQVAIDADVTVFSVGSELLSTERQPDRWAALIAHARSRFSGRLTYSTNWDHYHVPTVWGDLDYIGISGYWDITGLTDPDAPDPNKLAERWSQIRDRVLEFGRSQNRPVMFTEIGYPSLPWALTDPWNYVNGSDAFADGDRQAMGYSAFLAAWTDLLAAPAPVTGAPPNPLAGVFFYEWDPYHQGGPADTGYGVRGKPAERILRRWLLEYRDSDAGDIPGDRIAE